MLVEEPTIFTINLSGLKGTDPNDPEKDISKAEVAEIMSVLPDSLNLRDSYPDNLKHDAWYHLDSVTTCARRPPASAPALPRAARSS